jgi:hypothetical protein
VNASRVRALTMAGLVLVAAAGCAAGTEPSAGDASPSAAATASPVPAGSDPPTASATAVPTVASSDPSPLPPSSSPPSDACTIEQAPGPGDEPPRGGELDTSNQGGGRFALCLLGPPGERVEGTAWCTWTPDRLAVQEVTGLPTEGRAGLLDVYLDLRSNTIQLAVTSDAGDITTYGQPDVPGAIRDDGSDGLSAFDAPLADGSDPPAGAPPRQTGTFRWQCAGPPPG